MRREGSWEGAHVQPCPALLTHPTTQYVSTGGSFLVCGPSSGEHSNSRPCSFTGCSQGSWGAVADALLSCRVPGVWHELGIPYCCCTSQLTAPQSPCEASVYRDRLLVALLALRCSALSTACARAVQTQCSGLTPGSLLNVLGLISNCAQGLSWLCGWGSGLACPENLALEGTH